MEKVDLLVAATGAVAVVATLVGLVFYDDLSGEADLTFPERPIALEAREADLPPAGTADFSWNATENATAALFNVTLSFAGRAVQGGEAVVELRVTGPEGSTTTLRESWSIEAAATEEERVFQIVGRWAMPPQPVRADPDRHDAALAWEGPVALRLAVTPPADGIAPGVAEYAFHAAVEGTLYAFLAVEDGAAATEAVG